MQWLMWQMGGLGPMAGQAHHFLHFNPGKSAYAEERFARELLRLYAVLDKQLADQALVCGSYSIADVACWHWVSRYEWQQCALADYPNLRRWYREIRSRAAVQKGYHVPKVMGDIPPG